MSVPSNREHHYRNLRDRYTNCTYVDGNLELTWLQDENLDLSFLEHIREVTGYVLISHVDVRRIILPSLQIVRGRTLFKLTVQDDEFALIVTLSKMHNLEMPALRGESDSLKHQHVEHEKIQRSITIWPIICPANFVYPAAPPSLVQMRVSPPRTIRGFEWHSHWYYPGLHYPALILSWVTLSRSDIILGLKILD